MESNNVVKSALNYLEGDTIESTWRRFWSRTLLSYRIRSFSITLRPILAVFDYGYPLCRKFVLKNETKKGKESTVIKSYHSKMCLPSSNITPSSLNPYLTKESVSSPANPIKSESEVNSFHVVVVDQFDCMFYSVVCLSFFLSLSLWCVLCFVYSLFRVVVLLFKSVSDWTNVYFFIQNKKKSGIRKS